MAFDYSSLNLDIIASKPLDENNLKHWQESRELRVAFYDQWKDFEDKRVVIDGVKYRLVKM